MITKSTNQSEKLHSSADNTAVYYGLSTDTKPSASAGDELHNGDKLIEMDTGTIYFYDQAGDRWLAWGA